MVLQPSPLHRWLGLTPGDTPSWVCAKSSCTGFDIFVFVEVALIGVSYIECALFGSSGWWIVAAIVAATAVAVTLDGPFEKKERLARARLRRGECRWCGHRGMTPGLACGECGNTA